MGSRGDRASTKDSRSAWCACGIRDEFCRSPDRVELPVQLASFCVVRRRKMRQPKIIVVGGGLAGLMATIKVAEAGVPVDLFSIVPVKRSHSVCAQGGINAAK